MKTYLLSTLLPELDLRGDVVDDRPLRGPEVQVEERGQRVPVERGARQPLEVGREGDGGHRVGRRALRLPHPRAREDRPDGGLEVTLTLPSARVTPVVTATAAVPPATWVADADPDPTPLPDPSAV